MNRKCNYSGDCESKIFGKECRLTAKACCHQDKPHNSEKIRVGPDQDGRWYSVTNENYNAAVIRLN